MKKWMLMMLVVIPAIVCRPMLADENVVDAYHDFTYKYVEYRVIDEDSRTCMTKPRDSWQNCSYDKNKLVIHEEVSDGTNFYKVVEIGEYSFHNCSNLVSVVLPESVRTIWASAFADCKNIKTITLPSCLSVIGRNAFGGCASLTKIEIPDGVEHINDYTFSGCTSLASVKLPSNLKTIGEAAFLRCGFEEIDLPDSLEVIEYGSMWLSFRSSRGELETTEYYGDDGNGLDRPYEYSGVFSSSKLKRISIPDNVKEVGSYAFAKCQDLEYIKFPKCLKVIENSVCHYCGGLDVIEFPDSLKEIGFEAFKGCRSMQRLDIPEGTKLIDIGVFNDCWNLKTIVFPESLNSLGSSVLGDGNRPDMDIYYRTSSPKDVADGWWPAFHKEICQNSTLYVGVGGLEAARRTEPWKNFVNIKEIDIAGVGEVSADGGDDTPLPVEVYDLQGRKIADSEEGLPSGLYIVKEGDKVRKMMYTTPSLEL